MRLFRCSPLVLLLALTACSGNPSLPERQIDRPYTLPTDTREFGLGAGMSVVRSDGHPDSAIHVYETGPWRIPISETWTWDVLTGVDHQFAHDATDTVGITFGAGSLGYSTSSGFFYEPVTSLLWRHLYAADFALEHRVEGSYSVRSERHDLDGWHAAYHVGAFFQLDRTKALVPGVAASLERNFAPPKLNSDDFTPDRTTRLTWPLDLAFQWRLSQGWETSFTYTFRALGPANGYRDHFIDAALIRYW